MTTPIVTIHPIDNNSFIERVSQNHDKKKISEITKIYIIENIIEPSYKDDIKGLIAGKKCWRIVGMTIETLSKIMLTIGGVLSFSSGYFNDPTLSFISGSASMVSLALLQFSSFSYNQQKKQGEELNILLRKLELETVPVLARNPEEQNMNAKIGANMYSTDKYNKYDINYKENKEENDNNSSY